MIDDLCPRYERDLGADAPRALSARLRLDRRAAARALYTTSLSRGEVLAGIEIMPEGRRRAALAEAAEVMFGEEFRGRILPFHAESTGVYAEIFARRRRAGRPIATADLVVAATASAHDAAIVTRDKSGFDDCGLTLVNPWAAR